MFGLGRLGKLGSVGRALAWTPAQLWPLGASSPGCWIDPPYTASLYQDSAGTTAISAIGTVLDTSNPVGLVLDRKGGLVLGAELVTNGDFSSGTTGWTKAANVTISGGVATIAAGAASYLIYQNTAAIQLSSSFEVTFTISGYSAGAVKAYVGAPGTSPTFSANGTHKVIVPNTGGGTELGIYSPLTNFVGVIDNISVKELPGIHLSQATAPSRPVASARVNNIIQSEAAANAAWLGGDVTRVANVTTLSDGTRVDLIYPKTSGNSREIYQAIVPVSVSGTAHTHRVKVKPSGWRWVGLGTNGLTNSTAFFDLLNGVVGTQAVGYAGTIAADPDNAGFFDITVTYTAGAVNYLDLVLSDADNSVGATVDGTNGVLVTKFQTNPGHTAIPYQRVTTDSDYDASAGPTYTKLDGVDDSLSSATFAAGTLASSMDCLIAVRRDSAADMACGLAHNWPTSYFGYAGPWHMVSGCGSPAVLVNGLAVPALGGYTGIDLKAVLTPGTWHIIEFRGLNLSAWTSLKADAEPGVRLNGALGEIQLFASGQDANRDLARAQMAAYFGVTLP